MTGKVINIDAYLERIGLGTVITVSENSLEELHRAQIYTIPFENFDILLGRGIHLAPEKIFEKLVMQSRGGYCFELNGLFFAALKAFGFNVRPLLARVQSRGEPTGRHHQLLLVNIGGDEWLADVGFGGNGLRAPVPFEKGRINHQDGLEFRLIDYPPYGTMLQTLEDGGWKNLYSFDLEHVCRGDIESGNHYTSTSPESFFTWARVATLPNRKGRISLHDLKLKIVDGGAIEEVEIETGTAYLENLEQYFGIVINEEYDAIRPLNITGS